MTFHAHWKSSFLYCFSFQFSVFIEHLECVNMKFDWVTVKPVLQKKQKWDVPSKKNIQLNFKKLILRNQFHQKSLAHLVHQIN